MAFDVIIAGAGITGLAAGLKLLEKRPATKLLILEKENEAASHQSGHNSGVIHSGIYYRPGSLKAKNCTEGYRKLIDFCERENVPLEICGKVIVAASPEELPALDKIFERGIANGLTRIRKIDKDELKDIEPYAFGIKAVFVPYTGITDFRNVALKFAEIILKKGADIKYNERVNTFNRSNGFVKIGTQTASFESKLFVNCCGLYSDSVAGLTGEPPGVRIIPFRGEYFTIKEQKKYLVRNLIYPVPNPDFPFLGVHFTRMLGGQVEAGPNAVLAFKREGYRKSDFSLSESLGTFTWKGFYKMASKYYSTGIAEFYRSFSKKAFVKSLKKLVPEIKEDDLEPGGSGVRAQAVDRGGNLLDDFLIERKKNVINVLNAPSPAATSSLSIGEFISEMIVSSLN